MKYFKKIIAIGAHFDDIEINCGGLIAGAVKQGSQVLMVVMGDGDFCDYAGKRLRKNQEASLEGKKAVKILGVPSTNLLSLNFLEKEIPYNRDSIEKLNKILAEYNPDLILTHGINDTHQDHINTAKAVFTAARYFNSILSWEAIFPSRKVYSHNSEQRVYFDVTREHSQKIKALKCHKSQIRKFKNAGINWIEGVIARDLYRGYEVNCKYAEAFLPARLKLEI